VKITGVEVEITESPVKHVFRWRKGLPGSGTHHIGAKLTITTDEGVTGVSHAARGPIMADLIDRRLRDVFVGRDPLMKEDLWERVWEIEPILFDPTLVDLADAAVNEVAATSHRLPSGPLHDAAEMARGMPTVMLFGKSLGGVSHTKEEDTPEADLELSVRALYELTRRTLAWAEEQAAS